MMLVVLLVLGVSFAGCTGSRQVILNPIQDTDIARVKQGESYTAKTNGWFISDMYMEEIMEAKIGE